MLRLLFDLANITEEGRLDLAVNNLNPFLNSSTIKEQETIALDWGTYMPLYQVDCNYYNTIGSLKIYV